LIRSEKIIFCDYLVIYRSDLGDLFVGTRTMSTIQQKKIAEIRSLDREIIFFGFGSGRVRSRYLADPIRIWSENSEHYVHVSKMVLKYMTSDRKFNMLNQEDDLTIPVVTPLWYKGSSSSLSCTFLPLVHKILLHLYFITESYSGLKYCIFFIFS